MLLLFNPTHALTYTACAHPEDGLMGRPKKVGATPPKCF